MKTYDEMQGLLRKMTVFLYPANSVLGGPIEEREVTEVLEFKVIYDKPDQYGYIGAKRSSVYFTRDQAVIAQRIDTEYERRHGPNSD